MYDDDDGVNDHRCYKWMGKICHNDRKKDELYSKIFDALKGGATAESDSLLRASARDISGNSKPVDLSLVSERLKKTPIKSIIEYSRSIHAEMEAIMSVARAGKPGIVGATLYTTTFPCHNCARHIVASGIARVIYIEPYAKSLALELHNDSIGTSSMPNSSSGEGLPKKVEFLQYEGVGPKSILKLFYNGEERKVKGRAVSRDKIAAKPIFPPPMDGFLTHEQKIIQRLQDMEGKQRASM